MEYFHISAKHCDLVSPQILYCSSGGISVSSTCRAQDGGSDVLGHV